MSLSKPKRATWTEDNLAAAVRAVNRGCSTYQASSQYGIPRRTLRNHVASGSLQKHLGRHTILGKDEEKDFVKRIIKFAELGIPLTPKMIRIQAFAFCEKFNIKHNFNKNTGRAGKGWLRLFSKRNPELAKRKAFGKCLLIFDGAKCHLDSELLKKLRHDIVLYCLPSNTTHELQPLDKACYKPFETYWDQEVLQFLQTTRAKNLKKDDFNIILTRVWEKSMTRANITSGFKATGLYPFDPRAIPETAFAPSILTERALKPSINNDTSGFSQRASPIPIAHRETEKSTDTIADSDDGSRQSSPIATLRQLQNLISETSSTSPFTPDLHFIRNFSSLGRTPPRGNIGDQDYNKDLPGPSGLGNTRRLVEYSDSDISSEAEIMCDFLSRPLPQKRLRIYSSTDSENDAENINPNSVPEVDKDTIG